MMDFSEQDPFLRSESVAVNYSATQKSSELERSMLGERENTPAYQVLRDASLLVSEFRKDRFVDIFEEGDLNPNSNLSTNFIKKWKWGVYWTPGCGFVAYRLFNKEVTVPPGHIVCFTDEDDNHVFAKPGVHNIQDPFMKQRGGPIPLYGAQNHRNIIEHGDRCCVTVPMGMVALLLDFGQPLLLPPGLHTWKSDTIRFERMYRLDDSPVIQIGPYTILTVDAGYYAVTMNNGKQVLLGGGTHLLTHQKWKFERFINMKVQSEDLREVNVASADNILMNIDATIVWKIVDAEKAAIMVTETIFRSDISLGTVTDDEAPKLRRDILKQAVAAIARFVSGINYAEYFNAVSSIMRIGDDDDDDDENENDNDNDNDNEEEREGDGVHIVSLSNKEKKKISLALTARKTVPFEVLLPSEEDLELLYEKEKESKEYTYNIENGNEEERMQLVEEKAWEDSIELAFNSAESIIAARRFTEYIASPSQRVKFVARGSGSSDKKDKAVLVMKSMGDWRRYGIQPLRVASEEKSTNVASVIYYTLVGGHFDGELKVSVRKDADASDPSITVIVTLLIGKGGRKVNAKLASKMTLLLADSIATSTLTAAKQTLSRKMQSTIYRGKAKSRASEKRHVTFDNIKKMEEMAEDRRRRWQRNNKGSGGSYRPTGCRPPDGGPRFGC
mmetsp:Transcript_13450/g.20213  ORF Transcript_13450/g.20213 Transcript_13450/m.20213 type:complete len:672 (+) Transcript_13450:66-2081(+)